MIIDAHVHVWATRLPHGRLSPRMLASPMFRLLARRIGVAPGPSVEADHQMALTLMRTVEQARPLDAAVVLALDAAYRPGGEVDWDRTHLYVANDYVADLAARHPKLLFGCSVHPYRPDAVRELERCVAAGAVLLKWLPIAQNFDPSDERCFPIYDALAHYKLPLLCHTGLEHALPAVSPALGDPKLLVPALRRGVTVIAAHCGSRDIPLLEPDWTGDFCRLAREHEHLYGDTAAFNLPSRNYAYRPVLGDAVVRSKLIHGSDWPLPVFAPLLRLGPARAWMMLHEPNWLRRDVRIKRMVGLDEGYMHRAGTILRLPERVGRGGTTTAVGAY
jgi:predicted TIM-barrel fold metal-dependent hydrolase